MKYLIASIICFIFAFFTLTFMGCSNKTPEFAEAYEAQGQVHSLATQVRGADRASQLNSVLEGKRFFANCETFARTTADLLIHNGAKPEDVWLVVVEMPVRGFVWEQWGGKWHRIKSDRHMIVEYRGYVIDNRFNAVLTQKDLEWEYAWIKRQNMKDQKWISIE